MVANSFGGTFAKPHKPTLKPNFAKEPPSQRTKKTANDRYTDDEDRRAAHNNRFTKIAPKRRKFVKRNVISIIENNNEKNPLEKI